MLIMLNIAIFAQTNQEATSSNFGYRSIASAESLIDDLECIAGGRGASSCDVTADAEGVGVTCGTTCIEGFYACCGLKGCHCIEY